jgi:hypothetical protein
LEGALHGDSMSVEVDAEARRALQLNAVGWSRERATSQQLSSSRSEIDGERKDEQKGELST